MFVAYDVSLELIAELRVVMPAIKRSDRNLADQIGRAATSVALNLAEGGCRTAGDRRRMYEIAHGSAAEVRAAIAVGIAWGWIDEPAALLATLDRLMGLLWRLTRSRCSCRIVRFSDSPRTDRSDTVPTQEVEVVQIFLDGGLTGLTPSPRVPRVRPQSRPSRRSSVWSNAAGSRSQPHATPMAARTSFAEPDAVSYMRR